MKLYSVYLPVELKQALARLAKRDNVFEGDAVREAIAAHLRRRKIAVRPWQKGVTRVKKRKS